MTRTWRQSERGMTLPEMLIALLVFSVVMAGALAFLKAQSRSFQLSNQRVGMYQNVRYALNEMEKDLRTAGAATPDAQPQMIYAGPSVVAFNANYWTDVANDIYAVYYNPDAPAGSVTAMEKADKITIPQTSFAYPDTSYYTGPVNSPSETIIFYFTPDTSTTRADDYVMNRQVNNLAPEVVARNILQTAGVPFLQYYKQITPAVSQSTIALVSNASLPLQHSIKIHLALNDTGPAAVIDSLRGVLVSFTVTNGLSGAQERKRTIARVIRLPNAGLANRKTCGDAPILGTTLVATLLAGPSVRLTWTQATDESGGEKDVERYVIFRKLQADPDWGDPYLAVPAGSASYSYTDAAVNSGDKYYYALSAEDCTPQFSSLSISALITIP
jgi:prepilin-type N-terminal cleavage/methylation domain-containing protein